MQIVEGISMNDTRIQGLALSKAVRDAIPDDSIRGKVSHFDF